MEEHLLHPDRHIPVERAFNIRDIGGYPTSTGGTTQWNRFLRSDGLHALHEADVQVLLDHGVRTVVDLRLPRELELAPNVFRDSNAVDYHHLSFIDDAVLRKIEQTPVQDRTHLRADKGYRLWLDECQSAVRDILVALADHEEGVVLYHCSGGKDRTGLVTALLLGLVGVANELIAADYALTARYNIQSTLKPPEPDIRSWQDYEAAYCPPAVMHQSLDHLTSIYGGIEGYVRGIGVSDEQIAKLRNRLTAD
ncbi:MAG: tyrosine-protein phosphatase [Pseudomonadota bacterium]